MTREMHQDSITNIGNIPQSEDFQRVSPDLKGGKTGEPAPTDTLKDRGLDIAHTVKGMFAEHSNKLFAITTLIGFILVFYSGNMKSWDDLFRYTSFLGIFLIFYLLLLIGFWISTFFKGKN